MKKSTFHRYNILILSLFLIGCFFLYKSVSGQTPQLTKLYKGSNTNYSALMLLITPTEVYEGKTTNYDNQIFVMEGFKIFKGSSINTTQIKYRIDGNKIRDQHNKVFLTIRGEQVFWGKSTNIRDIFFTYDGTHVYNGSLKNYQKIWYTVDEPISIYTLAWLLGDFYK